LQEPGVNVPHPRFRERAFVLDPLIEIDPALRDPVTGLTVVELRAALGA
jgi:2-amino-4-hydroxy-6-hydroxymethyldihydropteridine diphosphokinase